jgi:GNAT superfamily N-acetyltransferase
VNEGARLATAADVGRLAELAASAVTEQAGDRGGAVWSVREARPVPAEETLTRDLSDDDTLVLAGTIDDVVVGYAVVHVEPMRDGRLLGVLSDVYVEEEARAVGVGEALVDRVLEWCRERGCAGVDALALPGNRESKNFFETFGFTARALVVHRSLS